MAITGAPDIDENNPDRLREAATVAAGVAGELRVLRARLEAVGLLGSRGYGPKLRTRLDVSSERLDELAHSVVERLAKLERPEGASDARPFGGAGAEREQ